MLVAKGDVAPFWPAAPAKIEVLEPVQSMLYFAFKTD
jgi:hypothetical protein